MKQLFAMCNVFLAVNVFTTISTYANGVPALTDKGILKKFQILISEYNLLINGIWGCLVVLAVGIFFFHFIRLGRYGGSPVMRAIIINDLFTTGVCVALLGSFWFIYFILVRIAM